jgi:hypothetical protein
MKGISTLEEIATLQHRRCPKEKTMESRGQSRVPPFSGDGGG